MKRLVILISGTGTNLEAILNSELIKTKCEICLVVSNNKDAGGLEISKNHNIPTMTYVFDKNSEDRDIYDKNLASKIKQFKPDLLVLAGWMHVLTNYFLREFSNIINLHPALPGQFPGYKAIHDAYAAFQRGEITKTGIMVHNVVEEIDTGDIIDTLDVPLFSIDKYEDVVERIKILEKPLLISSIIKVLDKLEKVYIGKVRNVYDIGYNLLKIEHSDRLSAFDNYVCDIEGKGLVLNLTSKFWFEKTKEIIPNHMLYADDCTMIVKKCVPFKIEVIVRNFITGSLWNTYNAGNRSYCGIELPDGLHKNQKLEHPIITPTTKGDIDEPITAEEIVERKIMKQEEWDYIATKAIELFKFGYRYSLSRDLILVDTKYEFGKDINGNIILIDEIHTCDSSRYWLNDFTINEEPKKLDKDIIRDYCKEHEGEIPTELKKQVKDAYYLFYKILINKNEDPVQTKNKNHETIYFENIHDELVVIISGSDKDESFVKKIRNEMHKSNIYFLEYVASAHKQTTTVLNLIKKYENQKNILRMVWVTVAGRSNALSGVVAANSSYPVIACPPFKDKTDMMININSSLQCPSNVPVLTTLEPSNVALVIKKMFNFS